MTSAAEFRARQKAINQNITKTNTEADQLLHKIEHVRNIAANAAEIYDDLDREFEKRTKLNKLDMQFLFLATFIQVARWWILDNKALRLTSSDGDKYIGKLLKKTTPKSCSDILLQSVPYDATAVKLKFKPVLERKEPNGTGLSGSTHRYRTLGHDPILGWIFGSANILTDSLTKTDGISYSIEDMQIADYYNGGTLKLIYNAIDLCKADNSLLLAAVCRQAVHFGSDAFTKQGLPLPFLSTADPEFVKILMTKAHTDIYATTRGALLANFINTIISYIHLQFFDGDNIKDLPLYQIRTKKIIMYSNSLSSCSNIAYVAATRDFSKLDLGGIIVALYELFNDIEFIRKIKRDFITGQFEQMITGE